VGLVACGDGGGGTGGDPVVARVSGHDVRQSAVDGVQAEARLVGQKSSAAAALDQAIEREIVREEAVKLGVTAPAAAVDDRAAQVREQLGGASALSAALKKAEMSRQQLRASLEAAVLLERLRAAKYPDVAASVAEARRFYERRRAGLFTRQSAVDLGAIVVRNKGIAGNALKRLRAGRPFAEVSRQFSIDPQLKDAAGSLGWIDPRSLPGALGKTVARLPLRAVSAPVAGAGGVWIFKVLRRRPAEVIPFSDVRGQVLRKLTARKRSKAMKKWLERAVRNADVEKL
jgi:foldase protein PrsA